MKNALSSDGGGRERLVTLAPGDTLSHPGSTKSRHYIKGPAKALCIIHSHGLTEVVVNPDTESWLFVFGHLRTERYQLEQEYAKLPDDPEDDDADQVFERQSIMDGFRRIAQQFEEGIQFINQSLSTGGRLPKVWEEGR
jgi:hypothetical protein